MEDVMNPMKLMSMKDNFDMVSIKRFEGSRIYPL